MWRQKMWRQNAASAGNAASRVEVAASQVSGTRRDAISAPGGKVLALLRPLCKEQVPVSCGPP